MAQANKSEEITAKAEEAKAEEEMKRAANALHEPHTEVRTQESAAGDLKEQVGHAQAQIDKLKMEVDLPVPLPLLPLHPNPD